MPHPVQALELTGVTAVVGSKVFQNCICVIFHPTSAESTEPELLILKKRLISRQIHFMRALDMKKTIQLLLLFSILTAGMHQLRAQSKTAVDKADIEYESQFDDPYDLNKMWLNFYPFYVDAFTTNFNVGFGGQINYLLKNKFDFHAHARTTYARFADFSRLNGERSAVMMSNPTPDETDTRTTLTKLKGYHYMELGATYHFKDEAVAGESKIMVYTNRYSDRKWAATVPEYIKIPTKVRKIMGVRAGGYYWRGATNLGEALDRQNQQLVNAEGAILPTNAQLYTNVQSAGVFTGFKISTIRNVVVKPKKYDVVTSDMVFSAYADILYAPFLQIEDVSLRYLKESNGNKTSTFVMYPVSQVAVRRLGFRLGMEGMFNRELAWTYGAEMGFRPSLKTRGFFASVRVGFSFGSKMQQKRQAYQVETKTK